MPIQNIDLTDHFEDFVSAEIEAGHYRDASEVLRAGLRLLQKEARQHEHKLAILRALAEEGFTQIDQGFGIELNSEEDIAEFMAKLSLEVDEEFDRRPQKAS